MAKQTRASEIQVQRSLVKTCHHCSYDLNPITAARCEICDHPLAQATRAVKLPSALPWLGLLTALLCLGGGAYLFQLSRQALGPLPRTGTTQPRLENTSGLPLVDTMAEVQNVPSGLFNYGGAFLFAQLTAHGMNAAIAQAHPEFRLRYTEPLNSNPGSGVGIAMLIDGQLSFSHAGRPLKDAEYAKARGRGFDLDQIPVAIDGIAFYTHPDVAIPGLTVAQAQAIFQGKIQNWRQVGGPNLTIVPVSLNPKLTSSMQILFEGLKDAQLGNNVRITRDYTSSIRQVAATPGAISYASAPSVLNQRTIQPVALAKANSTRYIPPIVNNQQVNINAFQDGSYPLTRRLFVIVRRDDSIDETAGAAYASLLLSKEGQKIIQKAGFVPIR